MRPYHRMLLMQMAYRTQERTRYSRLGNIVKFFFFYCNHTGKVVKDPTIRYILVYSQPRWYRTVQLLLFSDSITFIQHIHRVVMILRCDPYSQHEAGFMGRDRTRDGLYRGSHDETSSILPSWFLRAPVSCLELPFAQCGRD